MRSWVFLVLVQGVFGPPPVKRPEGAGENNSYFKSDA